MKKWLLFLALALCIVAIANVDVVQSIVPGMPVSPQSLTTDFQVTVTPQAQGLLRQSMRTREGILFYYPGSRSPEIRRIDRSRVFRIRSDLIDQLEGPYYARSASLNCNGHAYFNKDIEILTYLAYLSCMREFRYPEAQFISSGGIPLRTSPLSDIARFQDVGVIRCNTRLKEVSRRAIGDLLKAERLAVQATIMSSRCDKSMVDSALERLQLAQVSSPELAVNLYRSAWRQVVSCQC